MDLVTVVLIKWTISLSSRHISESIVEYLVYE